jgi:hypothetical protein
LLFCYALLGGLDVLRIVDVFTTRAIAGFFQLNEFGSDLGAGNGAIVLRESEARGGQCRRENESGDEKFFHDDLKGKIRIPIYLTGLRRFN